MTQDGSSGAGTAEDGDTRATIAARELGLTHRVVRHGPVASLQEAAAVRGVDPSALVKTLVVRRADDDFVLVLVPGDRTIAWPKLRSLLGVQRLSMPDADTAQAATGYARGTITPLGSLHPWPVIADETLAGRQISLGGGAHGVGLVVAADELVERLGATVADVTQPT